MDERPWPGLPSGKDCNGNPTMNNLVVRRFEGCWTCTGSRKPRPRSALRLCRHLLAIADLAKMNVSSPNHLLLPGMVAVFFTYFSQKNQYWQKNQAYYKYTKKR